MKCHKCGIDAGPEPQTLQLSRFRIRLCDLCYLEAEDHLDDCAGRSATLEACSGARDCPCVGCAERRILTPVPTPGLCQGCERPIVSTLSLCSQCSAQLEAYFDELALAPEADS